MPRQTAPVAPLATCIPGRHVPVVDQMGKVVSPKMHFGDGLDGRVECLSCGQIIGETDRQSLGGVKWYEEGGD